MGAVSGFQHAPMPFPAPSTGKDSPIVKPADVPRLVLATASVVALALGTGCGAENSNNSIVTTSIGTAATDPSPPPSSVGPTTTAFTTTTELATTSPTAVELAIPTGTFETTPADLFVLALDGDLELWTAALTSTPVQRTLVADYPDPFAAFSEGTGPNVIDHVAGEIGGTVVFGDCCEPISGNVIAARRVDDVAPISGGYSPTLSPTRDLLGTANDQVITQTAADSTGAGLSRPLNQQPDEPYRNVADLTWSSNSTTSADDDHMVLLVWDEDGWWLHDVDRSTLEPTPALELGVPSVEEAPDTTMQFAGHGPDSEIVVAQGTPDTTRLRYFDPRTLTELPQLERSLPGSASSIRLADDGLGLLWVDRGDLYVLSADETAPRRLGQDVLAAWFA